jgi:hypothetical protein
MPVVLLKWYTIPPSVQGARTTLKENNSSVAKQEIKSEKWLVANSGGRSAEESGDIEFSTEFGVTERR